MRPIATLIVTLTLLLPGEGAKAMTTLGDMMRDCEKLESFWRLYPPTPDRMGIPNQADPAVCYGFMLAFNQLQSVIAYHPANDCSKGVGPSCRHALGMCIPEGVLFNQILAVFLAYARSHVAQWHEQASSHYLLAMLAAFPCSEFAAPDPK
jgi:hypothetical protein